MYCVIIIFTPLPLIKYMIWSSYVIHDMCIYMPQVQVFKPEQGSLLYLDCEELDSLVIAFVHEAMPNFDLSFYSSESKTVLLKTLAGAQSSLLPGMPLSSHLPPPSSISCVCTHVDVYCV